MVAAAPLTARSRPLVPPRGRPGGNISYEEYHPYGTTAWWTDPGSTVSQKRYRYTGKEKDEESGLYYHGARYYAPWLARWTSPDPIGLRGGNNRYAYCRANPIGFTDPTGMAPKTYSQGGYEVTVNEDSSLVVQEGDWLSKYSVAIHGDTQHVGDFYRKGEAGYIAVSDPDLITTGETLYYLPDGPQEGVLQLSPDAARVAGDQFENAMEAQLRHLFSTGGSVTFGSWDTGHAHFVVPDANKRDPALLAAVERLDAAARTAEGEIWKDLAPGGERAAAAAGRKAEQLGTTGDLADATRNLIDVLATFPGAGIVYHTLETDEARARAGIGDEDIPMSGVRSERRYHFFPLMSDQEIPWPSVAGQVTSHPFPPGFNQPETGPMQISFWPAGTVNANAHTEFTDLVFVSSAALPMDPTGLTPWAAVVPGGVR
jgi:RHS repeat-associated protein